MTLATVAAVAMTKQNFFEGISALLLNKLTTAFTIERIYGLLFLRKSFKINLNKTALMTSVV